MGPIHPVWGHVLVSFRFQDMCCHSWPFFCEITLHCGIFSHVCRCVHVVLFVVFLFLFRKRHLGTSFFVQGILLVSLPLAKGRVVGPFWGQEGSENDREP